jgi:hypothetical protein
MTVRPKPGERSKPRRYDGSMENDAKTAAYDSSAVKNPELDENPKTNRPRHSLTIRARLFGYELRWQCGQMAKNLATPIRQFLRWQKSS